MCTTSRVEAKTERLSRLSPLRVWGDDAEHHEVVLPEPSLSV
jgi:hypothetical protein